VCSADVNDEESEEESRLNPETYNPRGSEVDDDFDVLEEFPWFSVTSTLIPSEISRVFD